MALTPHAPSTNNASFLLLSVVLFACGYSVISGDTLKAALIANNIDDVYAVHTENCSIPRLRPQHHSIAPFVHTANVKPCYPPERPPLLARNATHIWVLLANFPSYTLSNLTCCYRGLYFPTNTKSFYNSSTKYEDRFKYDACVYFGYQITVAHEFVRVTCEGPQLKYEDYFAFARPKFSAKRTASNRAGFNVIVLGIDTMSRMNFQRTMPKTRDFLKRREAVDLMGFNKVGGDTFENVVPLLMGIPAKSLKKKCITASTSTFDGCPFLWNLYKNAGFLTAFGEDSSKHVTFYNQNGGFAAPPTDYYLLPFVREAERKVGHYRESNTNLCLGREFSYQVLLDYVLHLMNALESVKLFGFFWETTMSHESINRPMVMDDAYSSFLEAMETRGHLERTVLVLVSAHGVRRGPSRDTEQGRAEEHLPIAFVAAPRRFRKKYALAYANLRSNRRRLTTHFDLHATLSDLIDPSDLEDETIARRGLEEYAAARGISLFLPVLGNRSCEAANIAGDYCRCLPSKPLPPSDAGAVAAADYLLRRLNAAAARGRRCAPLRFDAVLSASEAAPMAATTRDYTVKVRVSPGGGVYETTLRRRGAGDDSWALTGVVTRLNPDVKQSACVTDPVLKPYCYCLQ